MKESNVFSIMKVSSSLFLLATDDARKYISLDINIDIFGKKNLMYVRKEISSITFVGTLT